MLPERSCDSLSAQTSWRRFDDLETSICRTQIHRGLRRCAWVTTRSASARLSRPEPFDPVRFSRLLYVTCVLGAPVFRPQRLGLPEQSRLMSNRIRHERLDIDYDINSRVFLESYRFAAGLACSESRLRRPNSTFPLVRVCAVDESRMTSSAPAASSSFPGW
jgi:hypothetical protein